MGVKVLVVEDSEIARKMATMILSNLGCDIEIAKTGEEALALFEENDYEMILMDIGLPGLSGIEVTEQIREQKKGVTIPIFALTANKDYKDNCLKSGMDGFLSKPLEKKEALSVIELVISKRIRTKHRSNRHDDTGKNSQ